MPLKETKAFYLTSEFWLTVGTIVTTITGVFTSNVRIQAILVTVSTVAYALSRGLAKQGVPAGAVDAYDPGAVDDAVAEADHHGHGAGQAKVGGH